MNLHDKIREAVSRLNPSDNIWTADGAVRVDVISGLLGLTVSREDIEAAVPDFRKSGTVPTAPTATEPITPEDGLDLLASKVDARDTRIAEIAVEIASAEADMKLVTDAIQEATRERDRLEKTIDALIMERDELRPRETFQQAAKAAAQRGLEERKRRAAIAAERGLPPGMIQSPLDQAMSARGRMGIKR